MTLNGVPPAIGTGLYASPCDSTRSSYCTVTGTYWWDIDELEAANPGVWVGKPLEIKMVRGDYDFSGQGLTYTSSFSAQVVKKK